MVRVRVQGKAGEREPGWLVYGGDAEEISKDGRAQTSGVGGDRQTRISSCKPETPASVSRAGKRCEIRTPCRLAKTIVRPSHKPEPSVPGKYKILCDGREETSKEDP